MKRKAYIVFCGSDVVKINTIYKLVFGRKATIMLVNQKKYIDVYLDYEEINIWNLHDFSWSSNYDDNTKYTIRKHFAINLERY